MRNLKKAAAIICTATALAGFGMAAFVVHAQETVPLSDRQGELDTDVVNVIADQVYAKAGEKVEYCIRLENNAATGGYADSGLVLTYDPKLTPEIKTGTVDTPVSEGGDATKGLKTLHTLNLDLSIFAASSIGSETCANDGIYLKTWFTVPSDAKEGDTFPMVLSIDKWLDQKKDPISYFKVDGWIKIKEKTDTTSSTTATTTTTTQTTTTLTTTGSTSTTTETTSSTTGTGSSTTTTDTTTLTTTSTGSTTSTTLTTSSTTDTTTTTTASGIDKTTKTVSQPTAPPDDVPSTTKPLGPSTGDAGVGIAFAALASAAAAAVVFGIKRKEH